MARAVCNGGILSIIIAILATFLCIEFSRFIEEHTKISAKCLSYIGNNSLICLCLHLFSLNCLDWQKVLTKLRINNISIGIVIANILWVIIMSFIIKNGIKYIKNKIKIGGQKNEI